MRLDVESAFAPDAAGAPRVRRHNWGICPRERPQHRMRRMYIQTSRFSPLRSLATGRCCSIHNWDATEASDFSNSCRANINPCAQHIKISMRHAETKFGRSRWMIFASAAMPAVLKSMQAAWDVALRIDRLVDLSIPAPGGPAEHRQHSGGCYGRQGHHDCRKVTFPRGPQRLLIGRAIVRQVPAPAGRAQSFPKRISGPRTALTVRQPGGVFCPGFPQPFHY